MYTGKLTEYQTYQLILRHFLLRLIHRRLEDLLGRAVSPGDEVDDAEKPLLDRSEGNLDEGADEHAHEDVH